MSKLRIAILSNDYPYAGHSIYDFTHDLANSLDDLGHEVTIIAPDGYKAPEHGNFINTGQYTGGGDNNLLYEINMYNKLVNPLKQINNNQLIDTKYQSKKLIDFNDIDIIHGNTFNGISYMLKEKYPNLNFKILHTIHGFWSWRPPYKKNNNLVTVSKYLKSVYDSKLNEYDSNNQYNIRYVYNGINLNKYKYYENSDSNIEKSNRLLFLGNLFERKRPHIAIDIASSLNMNIDIVGRSYMTHNNYYKTILENSVNSFNKNKNKNKNNNDSNSNNSEKNEKKHEIKFYIDASEELKIRKLQEAKCLIYPSFQEPFGLCQIQAMSCGTPVITLIDGGATNEIIENGKTGFVCENVEEMKKAVLNIDSINPNDCRKHVEQNFSKEVMTNNYLTLYENMMNGNEW